MKFPIQLLLVLASLIDAGAFANKSVTPTPLVNKAHNFVPGELLVKFKAGSMLNSGQTIIKNDAKIMKEVSKLGLLQVKLPDGQSIDEAVAAFQSDPDVEFAQPNYIYKIQRIPNDTKYGQLWGLKNSGQIITSAGGPDTPYYYGNPGVAGRDIDVESAWNYITDCSAVVVAVVDSGVNYNHADLQANMWEGGVNYPKHGYNFVENNDDPMDKDGHGTHVAGTIGAVGNNGLGTTGICWTAKLMAVRVMEATGSGTTANIVQGVNFAVANGAKVINLSLGGSAFDAAFSSAISTAEKNGVIVVSAAGNAGTNNDSDSTPFYPCNYNQSNQICVAALDQSYSLAYFSNYGASSVTVGAPGINIVSEWPGTHTTHADTLTSGWTGSSSTSTGWGYESFSFDIPTHCLVNPALYDHSTKNYANNTDDRKWKSFDTSGAAVAILKYSVMYDLELNHDFASVFAQLASGDPVPTGSNIGAFTGSSSGIREEYTEDLSAYIGANTTIGFALQSDASTSGFGINVSNFSITTLSYNTTTYNVISGTSMAAPHVAGVAAMLLAYNPNYTYQDVITAIKAGGVSIASLTGKTSTGKAISAIGSLRFMSPPSGVSAAVE